jgi:hypothetical protein
MSSAASVLLTLLDHTDVATLSVLLDAENLLMVLRAEGSELTHEAPGAALLGLFESGRTPEQLLAHLGPRGVAMLARERLAKVQVNDASVATKTSPRAAPEALTPRPSQTRFDAATLSPREQAGGVVVLVAALAPPLVASMDLDALRWLMQLGPARVLAATATVGAIGGLLAGRGTRRVRLALAGALAATGGCAAVGWYMMFGPGAGRASVFKIEIALVAMLGMAPG